MKAREKRRRKADAVAVLMEQMGRKSIPGGANDRVYDHKLEQKLKRMRPEEVHSLLRGDDE